MATGGTSTNVKRHLQVHHVETWAKIQNDKHQAASKQQTVDMFVSSRKRSAAPPSQGRKDQLDRKIAKLILSNLLPLSFVDSEHFRDFISDLHPGYVPCCSTTLKSVLIPKLVLETEDHVRTTLQRAQSFAITTDSWTSLAMDRYVSLTAHFIDSNWSCESVMLGIRHLPGEHTGK